MNVVEYDWLFHSILRLHCIQVNDLGAEAEILSELLRQWHYLRGIEKTDEMAGQDAVRAQRERSRRPRRERKLQARPRTEAAEASSLSRSSLFSVYVLVEDSVGFRLIV